MTQSKTVLPIQQQVKLLRHCIDNGLSLSNELYSRGLTYDDLRYRHNPEITAPIQCASQTIEELRQRSHGVPAVSFFSGAGGLDIGFEYAGFKNLASIEVNELFCETLRLNFPNHVVIGPPFHNGDVKQRESVASSLRSLADVSTPFEGVFHGGPPCQPFSIAANQRFSKSDGNFKRRGFSDKEKGDLLQDYIWFIKHFLPKVFVIENVSGLIEIDNGMGLQRELNVLAKIGYTIAKPQILNAADFGVPQKRLRLIVVGVRGDAPYRYPSPLDQQVPCGSILAKSLDSCQNHITREHSAESVIRYMDLDYGQRDQLGRVDRLNPYRPSKTVIAGGANGGGRSHLHPYAPRTLSVRESARLQTFPDHYVFVGPSARQFTQVGNAVPPMLGYRIAQQIYHDFYL